MEYASVVVVTASPAQAKSGRELVAKKGLTGRIEVMVGDYHSLPFEDGAFDAALFLESSQYTDEPPRLFGEMRRLIRPGGKIYIKDAFHWEGTILADQQAELEEFDEIYAH